MIFISIEAKLAWDLSVRRGRAVHQVMSISSILFQVEILMTLYDLRNRGVINEEKSTV